MNRENGLCRRLLGFLPTVFLLTPALLSGQVDQRALATRVLCEDDSVRQNAVMEVLALDPSEVQPELRSALVGTLEQLNRLRREVKVEGGNLEDRVDPHFRLSVVTAVTRLRDPQTAPALVGALGHGAPVVEALASFGEPTALLVIDAVQSRESSQAEVNDGLAVLSRFAARDRGSALTHHLRARLSGVARNRLNGQQAPATLKAAIDLALALGDDPLVETVRTLASDPDQIRARGISDQGIIDHIQEFAAMRLGQHRH